MALCNICSLTKTTSWKHTCMLEKKFLKNANLLVDLFILKYLLFSLFGAKKNFFYIYIYVYIYYSVQLNWSRE